MRHVRPWLTCLALLLWACAAAPPHGTAALTSPQPRDCDALFPHQDMAPLEVGSGIESSALAEAGAQRQGLSHFYKCRQDNVTDQNRYLQALGDQLQEQTRQLQADVATYQQRTAAAQANSNDYNAACQVQGLDQPHYQTCLQRQQQVNQDIADVNAMYPELQRRKADQDARITAFDKDVDPIPERIHAAYQDYAAAIREQGRWLDLTRNLMVVPGNQETVRQAACPSVQQPAKTLPEMDSMTDGLLACLRRMPEVLLVPPPQAPRVESAAGAAALADPRHRPDAAID